MSAEPQQPKAAAKKGGKPAPVKLASLQGGETYIQHRLAQLQALKESDSSLHAKLAQEAQENAGKEITVTLPDGKQVSGLAYKTTPMDVASGISQGLANACIVAKINGTQLWDMERPLKESCSLELLKFDSPEGKYVFWHSSAHVLGEALERKYGCDLTRGPPQDDGFFYDVACPEDIRVKEEDLEEITELCRQIVKEKQPFERVALSKEEALEMFKYNKYKVHYINEHVQDNGQSSVYRCGSLVDLCEGPHVPHTARIKAFEVTKNSSSYWLGKAENDVLQRVYAISFPDPKQLKEWKHFQAEAKKRDHREIAKQQELFFFHPLSPGSCFFLPHGARIYNKLMDFIKTEYLKRGFTEVMTPNMYNSALWEKSGHWQHYSENMFQTKVDEQVFALKPMNCPGHCLMFGHRTRSHNELPLRFADFGVLHRNELAGALTGLTRVRRFQQDDAHIFCMPEQVGAEVRSCLEFMKYVYSAFGFSFSLELSTRPEKFLGEIAQWDKAEAMLEEALEEFVNNTNAAADSAESSAEKKDSNKVSWKLNPGDGAFYGPKIDIHITDALRRSHQCATVQLDFQLPERFELNYQDHEGNLTRPVIVHRAILGSVERMMAILIEHTGGKWPLWLSPRQVLVAPVSTKFADYAQEVRKQIHDAGYFADADLTDKTFNRKVREGQLAQYNFILVVGGQEAEHGTVNVRTRDNQVHGERKIAEFIDELGDMCAKFQ